MRRRILAVLGPLVFVAACATGSGGAPELSYGLPEVTEVRYAVGDTVAVEINALGQRLELDVESLGTFSVAFAPSGNRLGVTMRVEELAARLSAPLAGPVEVDETDVSGELVFTLDRTGVATVVSTPEVQNAGGLFSATSIANNFFPRLPGRAVGAGDVWSDTISFEEGGAGLEGTQSIALDYTVVGRVVTEGRTLLEIIYVGASVTDQRMNLQGVEIHLMTEAEVTGTVLWDEARGLMFANEMVTTGTGTVQASGVPGRLPTTVEFRSSARLAS